MTITLNGTTGITLPNGSASAPAATGSDTDTGIVYGTNTVQIATGGTTAVTVDSSQNVGIGTTSPTALLHLSQNGNTTAFISASNSGANSAGITLENAGQRNWQVWADRTTDTFRIGNNSRATTNIALDSSGNFLFNSGYGSVATAYGCRAWVNFNGTGTVAIRGSGNVTSITDAGVGNYTINLTNAMPDSNYVSTSGGCFDGSGAFPSQSHAVLTAPGANTSSVNVSTFNTANGNKHDATFIFISVFR